MEIIKTGGIKTFMTYVAIQVYYLAPALLGKKEFIVLVTHIIPGHTT